MLFNKNNEGTAELRKRISFLYANLKFENIYTDVELAEESLKEVIGSEVFTKAQVHYDSASYNPEGTDVLDRLVQHIQLPIAYFAGFEYIKTADVSHESTGRKVKIDAENEKIPFEWMLDRDNAAILNKAHKTTDRLILFLEKNEEATDWKDSEAQKTARSLFVNTAKQFDGIYPIDESRRFFLKVLPFMKSTEKKDLLPILGERFDYLKAKITANDLTADDKVLLEYVNDALVLKTMTKATRRFSISVIPEGVFQNYISERLTTQGKIPAADKVRMEVYETLDKEAKRLLSDLIEHINKLDNPVEYSEEPISVGPINDAGNKFFGV